MGDVEDKVQVLLLKVNERLGEILMDCGSGDVKRFAEERARELETDIARAAVRIARDFNEGMKRGAMMKKAGSSARVVEAYEQVLKGNLEASLKFHLASVNRFEKFCASLKRSP